MSEILGKVIIAGGSGFLGQKLACSLISDGYEVIIFGRQDHGPKLAGRFVQWDGKSLGGWASELEGAAALFNLAGRSVDCRYTTENKALILNSRVDATCILGQAVTDCRRPPLAWFNASTATLYDDLRGDLPPHDEGSTTEAPGFSEEVGRAWEKAFYAFKIPGVRQVSLRISLVLGQESGAFPVLRRLTRLGLGGRQGPGNQWISWLHVDDWVGVSRFLMEREEVYGPVNLASPNPVTNSLFMQEMRKRFAPMGIGFPAPTPAIYLSTMLIGTAPDLVLKSRKVVSRKLMEAEFPYVFSSISPALDSFL
tara:strand:+ start:111 stop:1040 length:930 start_codon:yes stop_codon:yes gene_type:complete